MLPRNFVVRFLSGGLAVAGSLLITIAAQGQENFKDVEAAAKKGDPQAMYKMGWFYSVGYDKAKPNMTTAIDFFKKAANAGVAEAQYKLGFIYDASTPVFKGVKKDNKLAVDWYKKAEGKVAAAKYALAQLYRDPDSKVTDLVEYIRLLQESAKLGVTAAQSELARLYRDGRGISKDNVLAMAWAVLAAEQGDKSSMVMCQELPTLFRVPAADVEKGKMIAEGLKKEIADNIGKSQ